MTDWQAAFIGRELSDGGIPAGGSRNAGVLVAITSGAEPQVILTRRALHLSTHAGQVSFPGGMWEPADPSLRHTALREAHEEIGLPPHEVGLVARLTARESRFGVRVVPFVGEVPAAISLQASPDEIDQIIPVPLSFFLHEQPARVDLIERAGVRRRMPAWYWQDHEIWGLTALIMQELVDQVIDARLDTHKGAQ